MDNKINLIQNDVKVDCVDFKKALQIMGMKYGQLYSIIKHKKELPYYQFGKKIVFAIKDLEHYKKLHYVSVGN